MQCVILAGGLGTRLGVLTSGLPKPMLDVGGRPFLEYEIDLLRGRGIGDIILCVGHLADSIRNHFGDGSRHGVRIRYSVEDGPLRGTAGAVKQAEPLIDEVFFLTYADAFLQMDYAGAHEIFCARREAAMMVVLHNENRFEPSNVSVGGGMVTAYDKSLAHPDLTYINFGVCLLRKCALSLVPEDVPYSQEQWFQQLIERRQLAALETHNRFYEIGSLVGLTEFRNLVATGALP
jgi:NDP-sugar pyrophosphorylase family protein